MSQVRCLSSRHSQSPHRQAPQARVASSHEYAPRESLTSCSSSRRFRTGFPHYIIFFITFDRLERACGSRGDFAERYLVFRIQLESSSKIQPGLVGKIRLFEQQTQPERYRRIKGAQLACLLQMFRRFIAQARVAHQCASEVAGYVTSFVMRMSVMSL